MFKQLRTGTIAGSGALVLVMALSGIALGAPLASDEQPAGPAIVDVNGDGIDDTCQLDVIEDAAAAGAAFTAVDEDGDGSISVTEGAHSSWVAGANCNHGGYVSAVAQADDTDEADDTDDAEDVDDAEPVDAEACEAVAAPEPETALDPAAANWHGAWTRWVAHSAATGGANCNHGGAVSEAAKKDHEAAAAEREARKSERAMERAARAQERDAAKAERSTDKAKGKTKGH